MPWRTEPSPLPESRGEGRGRVPVVQRLGLGLVVLLVLVAVSGSTLPRPTSAALVASHVPNDPPHRYVVLLDGIRSEGSKVYDDFATIRSAIQGNVPGLAQIVYFSYGAAWFKRSGDSYCSGWGYYGCSATSLGDLSLLGLVPVYPEEATNGCGSAPAARSPSLARRVSVSPHRIAWLRRRMVMLLRQRRVIHSVSPHRISWLWPSSRRHSLLPCSRFSIL